ASEHVARLVDGGMLTAVRQGRSRYVRLAGPQVAELIEGLGAVVATETVAVRSLREASTVKAMARARTCYDHLAGRLGVLTTDAMTRARYIDQSAGFSLTQAGIDWLAGSLDIDVDALRAARRPLVRSCIDWTERRPHLAGGAGAALCGQFFARGWITRTGTSRAVAVTRSGEQVLSALVGVDLTNVA